MRLVHFLAKENIDKGPLFILPCLRCDVRQTFHLYTEAFGVNLFGLKIALALDYTLRCPVCNYPIDLSEKDGQKALSLLPSAKMKFNDTLPEEEFERRVQERSFDFLKTTPAYTPPWICSSCNEQNPYTFSICWKCGSEHSRDEKDDPSTSDVDISHITEDTGANPYGTLHL